MKTASLNILKIFSRIRLILVIILMVILFSIINPLYLSINNFYTILMAVASMGLVVIGQSLCLIVGGFDLSVGPIAILAGVMSATLIGQLHINSFVAIFIAILISVVIGFINALVVTKGHVSPLVTTLAMGYIVTGLSYLLTRGNYISVTDGVFKFLGTYRIFGSKLIQFPIIVVTIFYLIFFFIMKFTSYSKYVYAVGGNKIAARYSGINVNFIIGSTYVLSGFLSGMGGILATARMGWAQPASGAAFALFSIAAAIIGGVSLKGGIGSVMGSLTGLIILECLIVGLLLLGLQPYYQYLASGIALIIAVSMNVFKKY